MRVVAACWFSGLLLIASNPALRLKPSAFRELPPNLVQELQRRGCTIPQVTGFLERENVIHGQFEKPGQTDWAVLCARQASVTLLVFWNGSEINPAQLAKGPHGDSFSRTIMPVERKYIVDHFRAYGGPKPPPINHQGIEDSFNESASVIHYYYRGKWLELTGAD
jgi:hypothetical protein